LLYSNIYSVVEAVVKTLDPNVPHMREVMLQSATSILHDLVKTYPSVDFSSSAQKLAVGTLEGASVIYDVRTATRSVVLEGHIGPVYVLAFSPDAKLVATCSLVDQSVRVWYTNLSLFGMLTSSISQGLGGKSASSNKMTTSTSSNTSSVVAAATTQSGSQKPHKVFSFAMPDSKVSSQNLKKNMCDTVLTRFLN
jgi:WD40 repeat protein